MNKEIILWGSFLLFNMNVGLGQSLEVVIPDTTVSQGDIISLPLRTAQFENIASLQFSVVWDTSVVAFLEFVDADLDNIESGQVEVQSGILRVSWFAPDGESQSLPDGSELFLLKLLAHGAKGSIGKVEITSQPLKIQIAKAVDPPGNFIFVALSGGKGSVEILDPQGFNVAYDVTPVNCFSERTGAIDLRITAPDNRYSIQWTGPDNFSSNQEDLNNIPAGSYLLQIRNGSNETVLEETITVAEPSTALDFENIEITDANCESPTGQLNIKAGGGTMPYSYFVGNTRYESPEIQDLVPGSYAVIVRDNNGCEVDTSATINPQAQIQAKIEGSLNICEGETQRLTGGTFSNYLWSTGARTNFIDINMPGTYSLTVSDENGCLDADTIVVVLSNMLNLEIAKEEFLICPNQQIELSVSGATNYEWRDTSGTLSQTDISNPIARPSYFTEYQVIGSNSCGTDTLSVFVDLYEITASAGPDTCVGANIEVELSATGGEKYRWLESPFPVSDPEIANPTVKLDQSTTFMVSITDLNGCEIIDSLVVLVASDPENIRTVNLITPNGDGKNDLLEFPGITKFGANTLRVYNRWGDLVFQKVNYMLDEERFDGTYKGQPLPVGNYYYILSFRTKQFKQTLTLLRE